MKIRSERVRSGKETSSRHSKNLRQAIRSTSGLTLYEALVAITLLAVGLLALSAAAGSSVKRSALSQIDMRQWSVVNRVADSLFAAGWGNVSNGSQSSTNFKMEWRVATVSAALERVDLLVGRLQADGTGTITDTLTLFLSDPTP